MRFVADESCDFRIVRALRDAGHDVIAITDHMPGATDPAVIKFATSESRVLLTEDKDFGQLVYGSGSPSAGVILIRFPAYAWQTAIQSVLSFLERNKKGLNECFVVIQPGRIRVSKSR